MIYIVGLGPGSREYLLQKAVAVLEASEVIVGFSRALESLDFIDVTKYAAKDLNGILDFINLNKGKNISVVASGDPCFYGISDYIRRNFAEELKIIPGISSFQYMMAELNKSWQGSYLGSLHGREEEFLEKVKDHAVSIWLTDRTNSPKIICERLFKEGVSAKVHVGENLSYLDERITVGTPKELLEKEFSDLSVVVIENELHKG